MCRNQQVIKQLQRGVFWLREGTIGEEVTLSEEGQQMEGDELQRRVITEEDKDKTGEEDAQEVQGMGELGEEGGGWGKT